MKLEQFLNEINEESLPEGLRVEAAKRLTKDQLKKIVAMLKYYGADKERIAQVIPVLFPGMKASYEPDEQKEA